VTLTRVDTLYRFKNIRGEALLVYTNKVPTGAYRGFGNPPMHFAVEQMMDMAGEATGLDPTEVRLRNATQVGDVSVHGWRSTVVLSATASRSRGADELEGSKSQQEASPGVRDGLLHPCERQEALWKL